MNPSPQQVASIQTFVGTVTGGWSNSTDVLLATMRATMVANPITAAPQVPAGYTIAQLMGLLSGQSTVNLKIYPGIQQLGTDIANQASTSVLNAVIGLVGLGYIQPSEGTALASAINATIASPAWTSRVSWDVANLGRLADAFDIEAARHTSGGQG